MSGRLRTTGFISSCVACACSIFLIDHAWTCRVEHARKQLQQVPGLLHRMANLMGIEFHGEVPSPEAVALVLEEMWKFNQTYQLAHGVSTLSFLPGVPEEKILLLNPRAFIRSVSPVIKPNKLQPGVEVCPFTPVLEEKGRWISEFKAGLVYLILGQPELIHLRGEQNTQTHLQPKPPPCQVSRLIPQARAPSHSNLGGSRA